MPEQRERVVSAEGLLLLPEYLNVKTSPLARTRVENGDRAPLPLRVISIAESVHDRRSCDFRPPQDYLQPYRLRRPEVIFTDPTPRAQSAQRNRRADLPSPRYVGIQPVQVGAKGEGRSHRRHAVFILLHSGSLSRDGGHQIVQGGFRVIVRASLPRKWQESMPRCRYIMVHLSQDVNPAGLGR